MYHLTPGTTDSTILLVGICALSKNLATSLLTTVAFGNN